MLDFFHDCMRANPRAFEGMGFWRWVAVDGDPMGVGTQNLLACMLTGFLVVLRKVFATLGAAKQGFAMKAWF